MIIKRKYSYVEDTKTKERYRNKNELYRVDTQDIRTSETSKDIIYIGSIQRLHGNNTEVKRWVLAFSKRTSEPYLMTAYPAWLSESEEFISKVSRAIVDLQIRAGEVAEKERSQLYKAYKYAMIDYMNIHIIPLHTGKNNSPCIILEVLGKQLYHRDTGLLCARLRVSINARITGNIELLHRKATNATFLTIQDELKPYTKLLNTWLVAYFKHYNVTLDIHETKAYKGTVAKFYDTVTQ